METVKNMTRSKKFWVFVITIAVVILNRTLGLELTGDDLAMVGGTGIAGILGFGMADFGKEGVKAEVAANTDDEDTLR